MAGHTLDKDDGQKDADGGPRRGDDCLADDAGAAHGGVQGGEPLVAMALYAFKHYDRIVDQHADPERQPERRPQLRAAEQQPAFPLFHRNAARALEEGGRVEEAVASYGEAGRLLLRQEALLELDLVLGR